MARDRRPTADCDEGPRELQIGLVRQQQWAIKTGDIVEGLEPADPDVLFEFEPAAPSEGRLER